MSEGSRTTEHVVTSHPAPGAGRIGTVQAIALRTGVNAPMREVREAQATAEAGLTGDVRTSPDRGLTLISSLQWRQVCAELGIALPWHTRRANILIDVPGLAPYAGQRLRIGELEVEITGETKPCGLMDSQHAGLRSALMPDWRGGATCRILKGGAVRVGDEVRLAPVDQY